MQHDRQGQVRASCSSALCAVRPRRHSSRANKQSLSSPGQWNAVQQDVNFCVQLGM